MAMKSFVVDDKNFVRGKPPPDNLCYFLAEVGTIWLQGAVSPSGQGDSRATFVWFHEPGDIDAHSETLTYVDDYSHSVVHFWHYTMNAKNEAGDPAGPFTVVDLLIAKDVDKAHGGYPVYYLRRGIETAKNYVLWAWDVKRFDGHKD